MSAPTYFVATDGINEPTVWRQSNADAPIAIVRRCDLAATHRDEAWTALTSRMSATADGAATGAVYATQLAAEIVERLVDVETVNVITSGLSGGHIVSVYVTTADAFDRFVTDYDVERVHLNAHTYDDGKHVTTAWTERGDVNINVYHWTEADEPDGAPCCPDPGCPGRGNQPCTFPGYVEGN